MLSKEPSTPSNPVAPVPTGSVIPRTGGLTTSYPEPGDVTMILLIGP